MFILLSVLKNKYIVLAICILSFQIVDKSFSLDDKQKIEQTKNLNEKILKIKKELKELKNKVSMLDTKLNGGTDWSFVLSIYGISIGILTIILALFAFIIPYTHVKGKVEKELKERKKEFEKEVETEKEKLKKELTEYFEEQILTADTLNHYVVRNIKDPEYIRLIVNRLKLDSIKNLTVDDLEVENKTNKPDQEENYDI